MHLENSEGVSYISMSTDIPSPSVEPRCIKLGGDLNSVVRQPCDGIKRNPVFARHIS